MTPVCSTDSGKARIGAWAAVRRVADRFRAYRRRLWASMTLVIVSVVLNIIGPLLLKDVINEALPQHRTRLLGALCLAMITAGILASAIMVAQNALTNSIGQQVVHKLRTDVYDRIQSMPVDFFTSEPNTEIQARLVSDIGGISDIVTFTAQGALGALTGLLASSVVMMILSWPLALAMLLLAIPLNLLNTRFTRKRRELAGLRQERVAEMLMVVGEDLTMPGVLLGRTFGQCAAQRNRFLAVSSQIADLTYRQRLAGSSGRALIGVTLACLPPMVYWLSGTLVPGLSLGTVVVLSAMQVRLSGPVQQLLGLNGDVQTSLAMFERVFDYLDLRPGAPQTQCPGQYGAQPSAAHRPLTVGVRQVSHRYAATGRAALTDIDLSFHPGTTTVIAGLTGSGKSTLALVLAGLVIPSSGTVEIDGRDAPAEALNTSVTLVAQDGAMFNASIRKNLMFAKPGATEAELDQVVAAAQLDDLVTRLPEGLDTPVGEHGYQLSGGERQRIAVARAMLAPSSVVVADEATSALDEITAASVHQALREHCMAKVLVIIAHRIPRLRPDDQVVLLEQGHIAERGTYAELLQSGTAYRRLTDLHATATCSERRPPSARSPSAATRRRSPGWRPLSEDIRTPVSEPKP